MMAPTIRRNWRPVLQGIILAAVLVLSAVVAAAIILTIQNLAPDRTVAAASDTAIACAPVTMLAWQSCRVTRRYWLRTADSHGCTSRDSLAFEVEGSSSSSQGTAALICCDVWRCRVGPIPPSSTANEPGVVVGGSRP